MPKNAWNFNCLQNRRLQKVFWAVLKANHLNVVCRCGFFFFSDKGLTNGLFCLNYTIFFMNYRYAIFHELCNWEGFEVDCANHTIVAV